MERRKKQQKNNKKKQKTVVIQSQMHRPPLGLALNWCSNLIKYSHTNLPQVGFEFRSLGCKPSCYQYGPTLENLKTFQRKQAWFLFLSMH